MREQVVRRYEDVAGGWDNNPNKLLCRKWCVAEIVTARLPV